MGEKKAKRENIGEKSQAIQVRRVDMREKSEAINGISEGWQEILKTSVMQPFSSVLGIQRCY